MANPALHLCSVIGGDISILPHFIAHYLDLGVTDFHLILNTQLGSEMHQRAEAIVRSRGVAIESLYAGRWDGAVVTRLINDCKRRYPDQWFLVADSDELQLYPDKLERILMYASKVGLEYLTGAFIDRMARDGCLLRIESDQSVWKQFPCAGFVSYPLAQAAPYKIVACLGKVQLSVGQHGVVKPGRSYPVKGEVMAQVHHFKWTKELLDTLKRRKYNFEEDLSVLGEGDLCYVAECSRVIDYLEFHGRIAIEDPVFLVSHAGDNFRDYSQWDKIVERTKSWEVLRQSPLVHIKR